MISKFILCCSMAGLDGKTKVEVAKKLSQWPTNKSLGFVLNAKESCGAAVSRNIRGLWGIWIKPANCCPTKLKPKIYKVCCVTSAAGYVLLQQWGEGGWMRANFGGVRAELAFARTWGWCLNCGNDQMAAVLSVNIKVPLSEEPAHNAPVWSEKRADQIKQQHCLLGFVVVITCILYGSWGGCGLCSRALRASVADSAACEQVVLLSALLHLFL